MKIAEYNQMMSYLTRPEPPEVLPQPKPPELLDIQEQNRKGRLLDSLNKIGGGLEDSSLDFIRRENFGRGKIPFTAKQQKIAEAYVEARGMTIEDLTASQKSDIRKGMYTLETASETLSEKNKRGGENRVLKSLEESQAINPKTNKVYTPEEWLNLTYSKRTAEKAKALDPVKNKERLARNKRKTYQNNLMENRKRQLDYYYDNKDKAREYQKGKFKAGSLEGKGGFLRDEQNRLLKYMQVAADKGNKNFKIYKEDEKFAGVKDIKKNKLYRDHRYKGTKGIPITKHPNHEEVQYFLKQAKRFKIERPNQTLGSYFSKYGKTPTYSEIYSFLKLGDRASDQTRKQNRLELHHSKTIAVSPTDNFQLALFDDNSGANKVINAYNNPDSEFYKNKNYADKELKKLNINLKIPGTQSFIGSEVMSPEKSLAVAKRKTVNLFKKEIEKDPKVIERLIASVSPNKKCQGFFSTGGSPPDLEFCFKEGEKAINDLKIKPGGAQYRNFVKLGQVLAKTGKTAAGAADILLSVGAGPKGLAVGVLLETGFAAEQLSKGQPGIAFSKTILGDLYNAVMPDEAEFSVGNRLLKSAKTEEEKVAIQNVINFNKDQKLFKKKLSRFDYLYSAPEFETEGVNLDGLEKELLDLKSDLDNRAPKVRSKDSAKILSNVSNRVGQEGRDLLKGFYGKIFGDRQLTDKSMQPSALGKSFFKAVAPQPSKVLGVPMYEAPGEVESTFDQMNLPTSYEATPEEIDANFDMQDGIMAAEGGRIGFADGPDSPGRRKFIKLAAGLASLPILGKFFKGAKVAKLIKPIPNSSTVMPDWFPNFVDKFIGRSIGKKIDADFMEYTNPDLPNIKLSKSDDGKILIEGRNEFSESYNINYEPPGYEVLDYKTGKSVKTSGEFEAVEGRHVALGPEDYDTDPFYADELDDLFTGDVAEMEKYATGNVSKTVKDAFGKETGLKKGKYDVDMAQGQAENRVDILRDEGLDEID